MKVLVFSDTHLTPRFDTEKYNILKKIISESDRVIINGDFWDGFLCSFSEFVASPWKQLFPLLQQKQTIYIYGNHDTPHLTDTLILNTFTIKQCNQFTLPIGKTTYVFEHGHRLYPIGSNDPDYKSIKLRTKSKIINTSELVASKMSYRVLHKLLLRNNMHIKKNLQKEIKPHHIYVFGHSHAQEEDMNNQFINTGFNRHGIAQYMQIDNNGYYLINKRY